MLRASFVLGLIAGLGCQQSPPPPPVQRRPVFTAVRAEIVHATSPRGDARKRGAVRGRPLTWCADPRTNDPLLLDAIELGTFDENDGSTLDDVRVMHRIALMPADRIVMVTDEDRCEHAARAYDSAISIYRSSGRAESIEAVHVVSLGSLYLVESTGDRRLGYEVKVFDRKWRHLRGGFGVEF